ncbi:hypothetical protein K3495_g6214 [Podosphaera aphanis]|nr:hypothetical protein K3495_g6214 [Podosphaera aphanis]
MLGSEIATLCPVPPFHQSTLNLTINCQATMDLDSTNAFEGPEKLLEIWFAPSADTLPHGVPRNGLKSVYVDSWKEVLDLVNCKVLSVIESEHVDAYLLSESSMFVFPHKLILKTCGTTTLLLGISQMLKIAAINAGFPHSVYHENTEALAVPYRVFYSRKNYRFPDRQRGPHRSWKNEVEYLDGMFSGGSAYMVGKMNGDHWYLYLTTPNASMTPPRTPNEEITATTETKILRIPGHSAHAIAQGRYETDETLEVLMTDLDLEKAQQFYLEPVKKAALEKHSSDAKRAQENLPQCIGRLNGNCASPNSSDVTNGDLSERAPDVSKKGGLENGLLTPPADDFKDDSTQGHALGTFVSEASGLSDIYPVSKYPNSRIDAYLFSPCGFSANGVVPALNGSSTHYFTVHVTPEPHYSYASFESNVPTRQNGRDALSVIEDVLKIFKPGRFSVTLFEARPELNEELREPNIFGRSVIELAQANKLNHMNIDNVTGYRRIDRIVHELDGYDLVFRYYEREDWQGGSPRLGEAW